MMLIHETRRYRHHDADIETECEARTQEREVAVLPRDTQMAAR